MGLVRAYVPQQQTHTAAPPSRVDDFWTAQSLSQQEEKTELPHCMSGGDDQKSTEMTIEQEEVLEGENPLYVVPTKSQQNQYPRQQELSSTTRTEKTQNGKI